MDDIEDNNQLTPETIKDLKEESFRKRSKVLRKQCIDLNKKIDKVIEKHIQNGKKDPYKIKINIKSGGLDKKDILRVLLEKLYIFEYHWYISIKIDNDFYYNDDLFLNSFFQRCDVGIRLTISENPLNTKNADYISNSRDSPRCLDCEKDNSNCRLCVICDDKHVRCVVFPCGHASYCWECADLIAKCGICRAHIFERRGVRI